MGRLRPDSGGKYSSRSLIRTSRKCALHTLGGRSPDSRLPTQRMRTPNRPSQGGCLSGVSDQLVAHSGGTVPELHRASLLSPNGLLQAVRTIAERLPAGQRPSVSAVPETLTMRGTLPCRTPHRADGAPFVPRWLPCGPVRRQLGSSMPRAFQAAAAQSRPCRGSGNPACRSGPIHGPKSPAAAQRSRRYRQGRGVRSIAT